MSDRYSHRPSIDPKGRENEIINLAMNKAEERIRDGSASNQLILEFVRRGSEKERLEKEKLIEENKLLRAKTAALEAAKNTEELYANAIKAMQLYSGGGGDE